jgi:hypothetical protein
MPFNLSLLRKLPGSWLTPIGAAKAALGVTIKDAREDADFISKSTIQPLGNVFRTLRSGDRVRRQVSARELYVRLVAFSAVGFYGLDCLRSAVPNVRIDGGLLLIASTVVIVFSVIRNRESLAGRG